MGDMGGDAFGGSMARRDKPQERLTEVELELMAVLWGKGEGTVRDVMTELPKDRDLAYTSVSTVLRILEQKGVLKVRKDGQRHIYVPVLSKATYEGATLRQLVTTVFETPRSLVARLIDDERLTPEDLRELRKLLDERIDQ